MQIFSRVMPNKPVLEAFLEIKGQEYDFAGPAHKSTRDQTIVRIRPAESADTRTKANTM